jgi:SAM-dependent methyltransferase
MKKYESAIFECLTLEHAKDIVLTPDKNVPNKFEDYTNYFVDVMSNQLGITQNTLLLDFGVGMGRVSKKLIDKFQCKILGTDISVNMLIHATMYVNNPQCFATCNRVTYPNSFDICIASLVLQHTEDPLKEIDNIFNVLKPNGYLVCLNDYTKRYVPGDWREDNSIIWFDDHFDVFAYLDKKFIKVLEHSYPEPDHKIVFYQKP